MAVSEVLLVMDPLRMIQDSLEAGSALMGSYPIWIMGAGEQECEWE